MKIGKTHEELRCYRRSAAVPTCSPCCLLYGWF